MSGLRADRRLKDRLGRREDRVRQRKSHRSFSPLAEPLESKTLLATRIWDGGGLDANWTTAANWDSDIAPVANDDLVFAAGAARLTNTNDFAANTNFGNITIGASGYLLAGAEVDLDGNIATTFGAGTSEFSFPVNLQSTRTFDVATGGELFVNSSVIGTFGLTKTGGGLLTLGGGVNANTYAGVTTVSGGTLGLFKNNGVSAINGNLVIDGTINPATVLVRSESMIPDTSSVSLSGADAVFTIEATGADRIEGLTLDGGTVNIVGSNLSVGVSGVTALATQGLQATIASGGGILQSGTDVLTIDVADAAIGVDLEITAPIGPAAGLTKTGAGTLTLGGSASNTYSGPATVNAGALELNKTGGATAITGALIVGDGSGTDLVRLLASDQIADASAVTVNLGATLDLSGFNDIIGTLTMTGGTVQTGAGTLTLGGDVTTNASSTTSTISGQLDLGGATRTFTVADGSAGTDLTISATISGTGAGITKAGGASFMQISGNNTYDGTTTVGTGGLGAAHANALGATSAGTTVASGALLAYQGGFSFAAEPVTISGNGIGNLGALWSSSGANTVTGVVTLAGDSFIGAESSAPLSIVSQITDGAGTFSLTKVRSGRLSLTNANPYNGNTAVSAGTLAASNDGSMGTGAVTVASGATVELSGGITPANSGFTISGSGVGVGGALRSTSGVNTVTGGVALGTDPTAIGVDADSLTINTTGVSGGGNDLVKVGAGTLNLDAPPITFSGDLTVDGGRLNVNSAHLLSVARVNAGATLGGTGFVGATTAQTGGTISPGLEDGTGVFNTAALAMNLDSTLAVQINGTTVGTQYDQLAVTGLVTIIAGADLSLVLGFTPTVGDRFTIVDNDTLVDPVVGTFDGLPESATINLGNTVLQISYMGGDGNDIVLTVTSVTSTWDGGDADDSLWSSPDNWVGDVAPTAGSNLVFPDGAPRPSNFNDFASNTNFNNITFAGSGYNISGNAVDLDGDLLAAFSAGASTISFNLALQSTRTVDVAGGGMLILSGAISGTGFGLTKTGVGTLQFTGADVNPYDGTTTVNGGTLTLNKVPSAGIAGAFGGDLVVGDNTNAAVVNFGDIDQIPNSSNVTINEGAFLDVNVSFDQIGSLTIQGGTVTIGSGNTLRITGGGGITTLATTNNQPALIAGGGSLDFDLGTTTFTIADDPDLLIDARVGAVMTAGSLIKAGSGILALSGTNTYAGDTNVIAGAVQVESDSALGAAAADVTVVASGASVFFNGTGLSIAEDFSITGSGFTASGALATLSGDATLTGDVFMVGNSQVGASIDATLTIDGVIDDLGGTFDLTALSASSGRVVLGGDNGFDGDLIASSGFLRGAGNNAFGDPASSSSVIVESGASLEFSGGITIPSTKAIAISGVPASNSSKIMSVAGDNTIQGDIAITGGNNVAIDVAGGTTLTVSGVISGSRDFDKNNTGTLILSGTNTHTGNVNVGDGTLLVDGSLATSNVVFVDGRLGGSGTAPAVTISNIGTLAPGDSPGILNTGNLIFQSSGSTYGVEINGTTVGTEYDQTNVTGTVDLAGATLSLTLGFTPLPGDAFTIINNDGADAIAGTFNGLAEGATFTVGSTTFQITYVGGSNANDVILTVLGTPTVAISSSSNPGVFGQALTFSVTVSGAGVTPTGFVQLVIDGFDVGAPVALDGSGQAAFPSVSGLSVGSHVVDVEYLGDSIYDAGSGLLNGGQVVNQASTATTVFSTSNPSEFGESVTFSVMVAPQFIGTPTGNVTLTIDGSPIQTVGLAGGSASFSPISSLTVGGHVVTVTYAGDPSFAGSDGSLAGGQVVDRATTVTALSSDDAMSVYGQSVTFSVLVTANFGGPVTGTVEFFEGVTLLGTGELNNIGIAVFTTSALSASGSPHSITAIYLGDATHDVSASSTYDQAVAKATLTVTADDLSRLFGTANPTLTASYTGFQNGETFATSGVTGSPSLTTAATPTSSVAGSPYLIDAAIGSLMAGNYDFVLVDGDLTVTQATSTATISSTANPSAFGQAAVVTVTIVPAGAGTPTGTVEFFDGATRLGVFPLVDGMASFDTAGLSVGDHSITAVYSGDANFESVTSPAFDQEVESATTSTTVTFSPTDPVFGQEVTVAVAVAVTGEGAGTPTGTIRIFDGDTLIGTAPYTGGTANVGVTPLGVGARSLRAAFVPDNANFDSSSATQSIDVARSGSSVSLSSSVASAEAGQPITLSVAVAAEAPGAGTPGGTVAFFRDGVPIGSADVVDGMASLTTRIAEVGSYAFTATYSGDDQFSGATSPALTQTVAAAGSSTTLSSSVASPVAGQPVTFTVTVAATPPGSGTPTGVVTFRSGTTILGTATLVDGVAMFTTSALGAGMQSITATYEGTADFGGSVSSALATSVGQATSVVAFSVPGSITAGVPLTLSASVTAVAPATGVPTGTMSFFDGDIPLAVVPLVDGSASYTIDSPTAGAHSYRAAYSGDANFAPFATAGVPVESNAVAPTILLLGPAGEIPVGTFATFTVVVSGPVGVPTGMVSISVNGTVRGVFPLVDGVASVTVTPITGDTLQSATAEYFGSDVYLPAVPAPFVFPVVFGAAPVTLTAVSNAARNAVSLIGTMTPAQTKQVPTGTITYYVNGRPTRTVLLVDGMASRTLSRANAIGKSFFVQYSGDSDFAPSRSETIRVTRSTFATTLQGPAAAFLRKGGALAFGQSPTTSLLTARPRARGR